MGLGFDEEPPYEKLKFCLTKPLLINNMTPSHVMSWSSEKPKRVVDRDREPSPEVPDELNDDEACKFVKRKDSCTSIERFHYEPQANNVRALLKAHYLKPSIIMHNLRKHGNATDTDVCDQ